MSSEAQKLLERVFPYLEILATVAAAPDNESTATPVWFVVDPTQNMRADPSRVAEQITGPFFSRQSAQDYLKSRRYAYGPNACVYCASGYWSQEYKALYAASKCARDLIADLTNPDEMCPGCCEFVSKCICPRSA